MDCDDQIRVVKRNDHPDALASNVTDVPDLADLRPIDLGRPGDYGFGIRKNHLELADPILRMTMPDSPQLHVSVRHEDESFWATVDEFPGVFATGDNLEELRESLEEGIALVLAPPGQAPPPSVKLAPLHMKPTTAPASSEILYA